MTLLGEMFRYLLHFAIIANFGAGIVIWALGVRESFLMRSYAPEWRGWLTLRRPLASELSEPYLAHRRMIWRFMLAFVAILAFEAFLIFLDKTFFRDQALGASL